MKKNHKSPILWGSLLSGGLIAYGCATVTDSDLALRQFEATNRVESSSKSAEITMDLLEVPEIPPEESIPVAEAPIGKPGAARAPASDDVVVDPHARVVKYRTRQGDTLMKLSFRFTGNVYRWREILARNKDKIADFNHLVPGTELEIPVSRAVKVSRKGRPYLIRLGDSLTKISHWLYGSISKWRVLWKNNPQLIRNPNRIYAGFSLYYPGRSIHDPKMNAVAPASVKDPEPLPLDKVSKK